MILVRGDGLGINPEDLSKIFDPFVRGGNAGSIPGTGLGLSIVKKAIDLVGESITVMSKPGEGSAFFGCHTDIIKRKLQ